MSILKVLTSLTLAVLTVTALHGERHCPGNVASVPLREVQGALIVAQITVNGAGPFDFLVDTGAQTTTVDDRLADQLGLRTDGTTGVSGVASYGRRAFTRLARVEVAGHRVDDVLAVVDNLSGLHAADGKIRGIAGENILAHFDFLIDNEHRLLCLDDTGALAAAVKGSRLPLVQPYGPNQDLPFTRPLVVAAKLESRREPILFRLDSGSNVPHIYGKRGLVSASIPASSRILKRVVDGVEQDFTVLPAQDFTLSAEKIRQVTFVQPMNSVGSVRASREDGLLATRLFKRVFVSYGSQFAIIEP